MRFQNIIRLTVLSGLIAMGLMLVACSTTLLASGKPEGKTVATEEVTKGMVVPYARGESFMLQIGVLKNNKLGQNILLNRPNPVMTAKLQDRANRGKGGGPYKVQYPESRHDDLRTAVAWGKIKPFAKACTFDIVISGVNPKAFGSAMILDEYRRYTGVKVLSSEHGPRSVVYEDVVVLGQVFLVLPMGEGVWGKRPRVTFHSKTCSVMNPGSNGKKVSFSTTHRTSPNEKRGVNTAQRMYILTN